MTPLTAYPPLHAANVAASIAKDDFYFFVREFWQQIVPLGVTFVPNWHIEYICSRLQEGVERLLRGEDKAHDYIVNQPPGTTKSSVISVALPAWAMARNPAIRVIGASYTDDLAMELSRKCRDVVNSEQYQEYFPHVSLRADQNTKHFWMTTAGGMRFSVGAGGSVVGMHGDLLITDDPINPEQASMVSGEELKTINRWISETLPSRKADKRTAVSILVMQRLHQNDPTGYLIGKATPGAIEHICLPSETSYPVVPPALALRYTDMPRPDGPGVMSVLDPVRMPPSVLLEARNDLGEYGFAGQHGQSPVPRGGGMFKIERIRWGQPPQHYTDLCRYWDKAGTAGGGAYTVGFKMGRYQPEALTPPQFWGLDVVRDQWDAGERENVIVATAGTDGRACRVGVEQEPGSGGKESAEATARRLAGYRVVVDKVSRDKTLRADTWAVQVNNGNFWLPGHGPLIPYQLPSGVIMIPANVPHWVRPLLAEMATFPFGKYKDQIDAGGGGFKVLSEPRRRVGAL